MAIMLLFNKPFKKDTQKLARLLTRHYASAMQNLLVSKNKV